MKSNHKKKVLITMVKEIGRELRSAQDVASTCYNGPYSQTIRDQGHERALALLEEYEKIRKML